MEDNNSNNKIIKLENFHILLWLLKDTCWVMGFKSMGIFMVIPTLGVAIYLTYKSRFEQADLFHNLAICSWITGNSVWMIGEFFFDDTLRNYATIFFLLGLLIVIIYQSVEYFKKKR